MPFEGPLRTEFAHVQGSADIDASAYGSVGVGLCVRRVPAYSRDQRVVFRSGRERDSSREKLHAFSFAAFYLMEYKISPFYVFPLLCGEG